MVSRRGTQIVEYPSELEIVTTRLFDAPRDLVFRVLTEPQYLRCWFATGGDVMTTCEVDLRVGGTFHHVFVTPEGRECSFRGQYLEIDRPSHVISSWLFEGWPNAWATETYSLSESDGLTTLRLSLAFRDVEGASHMRSAHERARVSAEDNGLSASLDAMEEVLQDVVGGLE